MSGNESGQTSGDQMTMEQLESENNESTNEKEIAFNHEFDAFPKEINEGRQNKHIPGTNNYQPGKSWLSISIDEAQRLVNHYSGYGSLINERKERVDFGMKIGQYVDSVTGESVDTTIGIIHYSNKGTHIVPARPKRVRSDG